MDQNNSKTSVGFMLSVLLHGAAIAVIALGPAFMPGMIGNGDRNSDSIEFVISEPASTLADIKPVEVPPPAIVEKAVEPVVTETPAPVKVKKPKAVKKVENPKETLPEKIAEPEPQPAEPLIKPNPVMADSNGEVETPVAESAEAAPEKIEIQEDEKFVDVEDDNEPVSDEKFADLKESAEELPAPTPAVEEPLSAAANAQGTANDPVNATSGSGSNIIEVKQSYLGLRQMPGNVPPKYATELRRQGIQGRGQLVYYVTRDGKVTNIRLTKSTGSVALDQAAVDAFARYRFVPGQEGYTVHDFEFSLKGPAVPEGGKLRTSMNR